MVFFVIQKLLSLTRFHLFIFAFISFALGDWDLRKCCYDLYLRMFCWCSLLGVLWYSGIFISLSHFEYDVRECSNFIVLHIAVQLFQYHLLKNCLLSIAYSCLLCCRLIEHMCVSLFLGSVILIYTSFFLPIPHFGLL